MLYASLQSPFDLSTVCEGLYSVCSGNWAAPEYCGRRPPEQWQLWEKPHHFNRTLGAQSVSSKCRQTSTSKLRESKTGCNCTLATVLLGNENSAQSFWPKFLEIPGSWTSAPSGHGCPRPDACFFQDFEGPDRSLGRDIRADGPWMSVGYPSPKLPLWADFSFLNFGIHWELLIWNVVCFRRWKLPQGLYNRSK